MGKLRFEKFDASGRHERYRDAEVTIRAEYATGGPCTHVARTPLGEVAFAYPLRGGERFVAVASARELRALAEGYLDEGVDECFLESTDAELEAGVDARASLL